MTGTHDKKHSTQETKAATPSKPPPDSIIPLTLNPARGQIPPSATDAELEKLLRENIRLTEDIQNLCESDSGNDILKSLEILIALRDAHEPDPITSRAASVGKSQRDRQNKRKLTDLNDDRDSVAAESPGGGGPSPKVMISTKERFMAKSASRAGSVPVVREGSVKVEEMEGEGGVKGKRRI